MKKSLIAQLVIWLVVIILLGAVLAAGIALYSAEGGFLHFSWPDRHSDEMSLTPDSEDASTYTVDPAGLHSLDISWRLARWSFARRTDQRSRFRSRPGWRRENGCVVMWKTER